jgi:hypothetical protein
VESSLSFHQYESKEVPFEKLGLLDLRLQSVQMGHRQSFRMDQFVALVVMVLWAQIQIEEA